MDRFDNTTLRGRVHQHLRQGILTSRIAPGAVLQEVPLAESLGVSRGPIREALGDLAAEGLVTITPRRGAVVASLTKRDFLEAYQVREALEALAVQLAVPAMIDGPASRRLGQASGRMVRCRRGATTWTCSSTPTSRSTRPGSWHPAIAKLIEVYRRLIGQMVPYRRPSALLRGSLEQSIAEHRAIIDAARPGTSSAARDAGAPAHPGAAAPTDGPHRGGVRNPDARRHRGPGLTHLLRAPGRPYSARWQATRTSGGKGRGTGSSTRQRATAMGQRGWKRQPAGMSNGLGGSPSRRGRCRSTRQLVRAIRDRAARANGCRGDAASTRSSRCRRSRRCARGT